MCRAGQGTSLDVSGVQQSRNVAFTSPSPRPDSTFPFRIKVQGREGKILPRHAAPTTIFLSAAAPRSNPVVIVPAASASMTFRERAASGVVIEETHTRERARGAHVEGVRPYRIEKGLARPARLRKNPPPREKKILTAPQLACKGVIEKPCLLKIRNFVGSRHFQYARSF